MGSSSDVDFLIFELQQSVLESEYKLKQDLLKFKYGRIKSGTSDSPSRSNSVPVAASKSSYTPSAVISTSSHPLTVSSTVRSTPSRVPVSLQHITHHPVNSTQNTQRIHASSAEFIPHSSGIQLNKIPSVVFSSIPSVTVCSTQDTAQDFTESSCISSGYDSDVHCVVHDSDYQSQSSHVQDSRVDISKDSSVSDIISTDEASVVGQFSDVSFGCSRSSTKDFPPSPVLGTTPEFVVVVSCQSDAEVITHILLSSDVVVILPSHYDSFGRFSSQFCYIVCTQKTDLFSSVTVCSSTMKSVIVLISLGFIDSDRRFLKRRRKVDISCFWTDFRLDVVFTYKIIDFVMVKYSEYCSYFLCC